MSKASDTLYVVRVSQREAALILEALDDRWRDSRYTIEESKKYRRLHKRLSKEFSQQIDSKEEK